jgi:hypothetical protein
MAIPLSQEVMFVLAFCHAHLLFRPDCQNDAMAAKENKKFF